MRAINKIFIEINLVSTVAIFKSVFPNQHLPVTFVACSRKANVFYPLKFSFSQPLNAPTRPMKKFVTDRLLSNSI
jgi:hypothetical protein